MDSTSEMQINKLQVTHCNVSSIIYRRISFLTR